MCLCIFAYKTHPQFDLILAFNRDEFLARPTREAHFWEGHPEILAGRDLKQGGTWLGLNKNGRIAFVTNIRDLRNLKENAPSRGALTTNFLLGNDSPFQYLKNLKSPENYNGFNLIVGDCNDLYYYSNVHVEINRIGPGFHGISNGLMHVEWDKVSRKKKELIALLANETGGVELYSQLFEIMGDRAESLGEILPDTGLEPELEKKLSAPFIVLPDYGTVSTTIISISKDGNYTLAEQRYGLNGKLTGQVEYGFLKPSGKAF